MSIQSSSPCPSCLSVEFDDDCCMRCGRPIHPDVDYFNTLERLAGQVVSAAYDEYGDLRGTAAAGPRIQQVIVELANSMRHYHYEGDGCLDEDE